MRFVVPRIYPILDSSYIPEEDRAGFLTRLGPSMADAGLQMLEYRNKNGTDAQLLTDAKLLRAAMPGVILIMDDRVDVALAAGFDGVHVDAGDLPVADARRLLSLEHRANAAVVGTSAGSEAQLAEALASSADYVAFGPIFPTNTKHTSAAPIGIEGVRRFRLVAGDAPVLVAAAGITLETASAILDAGANAVAVSEAIFRRDDPAAEFRRWMIELNQRGLG
jgi:thiamine-phosphate pyrophosphorylase